MARPRAGGRTGRSCSRSTRPAGAVRRATSPERRAHRYRPVSKTRLLRLRPAGSPEAPLSARACLELPGASASLGQSAAWEAGRPSDIVSTSLSTSSMSATLHHHVCCCSVHSHATSAAGVSADATALAGASAALLGLWGTQKLASGPCRSCKRPRQETSRERQRGQRSSPLLTPCSSTSRPPRGGRSDSGAGSACIAWRRRQRVVRGGARAETTGRIPRLFFWFVVTLVYT